jgi:ATP-dependent Clp protease ATP-binding subunit ClpB
LQIEREAVRRENDESSQKRFALIEEEIVKLKKEAADLEEIWHAEKRRPRAGSKCASKSTNCASKLRS